MSDLSGLAQGLAQGLNTYLQGNIQQNRQQQNFAFQQQQEQQTHTQEGQSDIDQAGKVTPDMAEQMIPGSSKWVSSFQQQNGRLPTIDETRKGLDDISMKLEAMSNKKDNALDKQSQLQDKLEKQAQDRITQVRGDTSLMRTEHQRDSAGMAYDTLAKAGSENRPLTELEQSDLIGQLWQARTGKAPTDQDMKTLNDATAKRGFNHAITYITGNPSLVGASTADTLANLKQFVVSTGQKADQQWSAYMGPRLVKPTSLDDDRWNHIVNQQRGVPFSDQMAVSDKTYKAPVETVESKRATLRRNMGL